MLAQHHRQAARQPDYYLCNTTSPVFIMFMSCLCLCYIHVHVCIRVHVHVHVHVYVYVLMPNSSKVAVNAKGSSNVPGIGCMHEGPHCPALRWVALYLSSIDSTVCQLL